MKKFDLFCLIKPNINNSENQNYKKINKKTCRRNPKKIKFLNQEIQYQIYKNETFIKNNLNNIFEKVVKNSLISEYYIIFSFLNELTLIIERSFILNQRINGPLLGMANQFKLLWYRKLNKKKIKYLFFYLLNKNKMLKFNLSPNLWQLNDTNIPLQNTTAFQFNPFLLLLFKNFLFPVKDKNFYKKNIKTKFNLMANGAILFCPDKRKLLNFVYNKKPKIKKTKSINFLTKDLKLNCLSLPEADYQKKLSFFNKNHSKLLKNNRFFSVHPYRCFKTETINGSATLAKNQITLKSDLLLKNLFYKQWFLNFLEPLKKSIFSFKNFIFFSRSKSISLSIKKLFLFLYLEPKFILNLEIVLKKTNLKFLLYSCLADKFKTNQFSNSKPNFSLSFQNKINTTPLKKIFKITSFSCQTSSSLPADLWMSRDLLAEMKKRTRLNNKTNYFKVLKFNLFIANQITSLFLNIQLLKEYSLPLLPLVSFYMRNKKQKTNDWELTNKKRFNLIQYNKNEISSNNRLKKTLITKKKFYKKILEIFYKLGSCPQFLKKITCLATNEFLLSSLINLSEKIFFNYLLSKVIFNIKNIINKRLFLQINNSSLNVILNKYNFKKKVLFKKNVLFKKYRFFNLKFNKITYQILKKKYYIFLYKSIKIYFMSNNFLFYLKKQYLAWVIGLRSKPLLDTFIAKTLKKIISTEISGVEALKNPPKLNILKKMLNLTVYSYCVTGKNAAVYFYLEKKLIFCSVFLVAAALFIFLRRKNKKKSVGLVCNCFIPVSVISAVLKIKKTNLFFNLNLLKNRTNILKNNARPEFFKYFFLGNRIILYNFIEHSTICKISTLIFARKVLKTAKNEHLTFFNGLVIKKSYSSGFLHKLTEKIVAGRTKSFKNESSIYKFRNNLSNNIESSLSLAVLLSGLPNKQNYLKQKKILIKIFNYKKTNFFSLKSKHRDKNCAGFIWQEHVNKLKTSYNNKKVISDKQKYNLQFLINRVDLENFFLNFYQLILKIQVKLSRNFFSQISIFHEYKLLVFDTKGNILNKHKNTFINILYKKNLTIKRKILLHTIFSLNRKKKEFILYGFYIFQKMVYQQSEIRVNNLKKNLFRKESQLIHYFYELKAFKKKKQANLKIQHNAVAASSLVTNPPKSRITNYYGIPTHVTMISGANILKDNKNNIHLDFLTLIIPSKKKLNEHNNQLKSIIFKSLGKKQSLLIEKLAPIIRKWCHYFKDKNIKNIGQQISAHYSLGSYFIKNNLIFKKNCISLSSSKSLDRDDLLAKQSKIYGSTHIKKINLASDFSLIRNLWEWSLKRHKNKNNTWIQSKYFYSINNNQFLFTKKRQICVLETLRKKNIKKCIAYQKNNCKTIITPKEKVFIKNIFVDITNHY